MNKYVFSLLICFAMFVMYDSSAKCPSVNLMLSTSYLSNTALTFYSIK